MLYFGDAKLLFPKSFYSEKLPVLFPSPILPFLNEQVYLNISPYEYCYCHYYLIH